MWQYGAHGHFGFMGILGVLQDDDYEFLSMAPHAGDESAAEALMKALQHEAIYHTGPGPYHIDIVCRRMPCCQCCLPVLPCCAIPLRCPFAPHSSQCRPCARCCVPRACVYAYPTPTPIQEGSSRTPATTRAAVSFGQLCPLQRGCPVKRKGPPQSQPQPKLGPGETLTRWGRHVARRTPRDASDARRAQATCALTW